MDENAIKIVAGYINDHLDKTDEAPKFEVYIVWKAKVLQNWKYLLSSTLPDGMYYECTYDGDKKCWYLDAYKKFQNVMIADKYGLQLSYTGCDESVKPLAVSDYNLAVQEGRCLACEHHSLSATAEQSVYCNKYHQYVVNIKTCQIQEAEDDALCNLSK